MRSQTLHDQRHVVVDQEHAGVVVVAHGAHDGGELGHLRLGQPRRGLVQQDEARLGGQRPRDAEPALVTVRRATPPALRRDAASPSSSSRSAARRRGLARRGADAERRHLDVLPHREAAERVAVLERPRQPLPATPVRRSSG